MNTTNQARRKLILHGWKHSATSALSCGASSVTFALQRLKAPRANHTKLCQTCGPIGVISEIVQASGHCVVVARFDAMAVVVWCDRMIGRAVQ